MVVPDRRRQGVIATRGLNRGSAEPPARHKARRRQAAGKWGPNVDGERCPSCVPRGAVIRAARGAVGVLARLHRRRPDERPGQYSLPHRLVLHAGGLRPRAPEPERADAGRALGAGADAVRLPGRARCDPLARAGARRGDARRAPKRAGLRHRGAASAAHARRRATASRRCAISTRSAPSWSPPGRSRCSICPGCRSMC